MTEAPRQLDCALWLAERGMRVFPVDHPGLPQCAGSHEPGTAPCDSDKRGKHPTCKWGSKATTDRAAIIRMFSGEPRNIGIACKPSGLLVVDEDEPDALHRYAASVGAVVEPTFTVTTSRGAHRYYRQPDGEPLGNGRGALRPFHIDVRGGHGDGGYVVGPGSVHVSGHVYRPVDSAAPITEAPAWLLAALRAEAAPAPAVRRRRINTQKPGAVAGVLAALVQVVKSSDAPASGVHGNRNERLFWASCRAFEHANAGVVAANEAASMMLDAAMDVGLSQAEAEGTIRSAFRNTGTRTPR